MTWEELLAAIHGLLGRRVTVWVDSPAERDEEYLPGGFGPMSPLSLSGILQDGRANELIESIREALPAVLPGDEILDFTLGDGATEVTLTLTKSQVRGAYRFGPEGVALTIVHGDLQLRLADQERLMALTTTSELLE